MLYSASTKREVRSISHRASYCDIYTLVPKDVKICCVRSVECSAGDDGDAPLVELVDPLPLLNLQIHREQQILARAVQIHWQHDLGRVRH